jgi:hypothetical protein
MARASRRWTPRPARVCSTSRSRPDSRSKGRASVIVDPDDFAKLPRASEEEEDMLDLAAHVTRHSRLSCQIWLSEALDTLTVRMPSGFHNMQGR